jgi:predicted naringenin-chalcone synthase
MQILQLSKAVPKNEYSTEELIEAFPCRLPDCVKQNVLNLGVSKRYLVSPVVSTSKKETIISEKELVHLCLKASEDALEKADLSIKDVGYFIAAYDANPFLCPGLSHLLIRKLGFNPYIKHVNVQGMACASFTKALELAEDHLATHPNDNVLLCASGVNSYWLINQLRGLRDVIGIRRIRLIKNERKQKMELRKWIATMEYFLFGDGVASCLIAREGDGLSVNKVIDVTNFRKNDYLAGYARIASLNEPFKFGFYSHLDKKLPKLGVKYTALAVKKLLGKNAENTMKAAKKWAIHTGSEKILNMMTEHYKIPHEKIKESYEVLNEYGNLSGASLPFILEKIVSENKFSKGDVILMLGFGWGFAASACLLEFQKTSVIIP